MELKPGYKQTEVGVIPEDWSCEPLSSFFSFISYGFTNPMPTVQDGVFMITAADINDGRLLLKTARRTSEFAYRTLLTAKSKPRQNDLLLTKDGTLGRLAIVGDEAICINQSVAIIRTNNRVVPQFLKRLLEGSYYQKRMVEDAGGSTIKHIYITIVDKMPIGLPLDTEEQRAIATALSDVDALLDGLDRLIAKKRDIKQAAMQQLLTGKTRLPGFEGEWEEKQLGAVAEIVMGQSPSSANYNLRGNGLPLIQGNADVENRRAIKRVFTTQITKRGRKGDVLMSVRAPVGEISRAVFDVCLGRGVCALRFPNDFLYHYLIFIEPTWAKHSKGSTFDSVNSTDVKTVEIKIPCDPDEQTAIATALSDMDAEIAALERRRAKTAALKQAMMQELLTGRTRLI